MLLNCGVGEDSWRVFLDCKEIQPVHPQGNKSWIFIGRTDAQAEAPIFWLSDVKGHSLEKTLMLGKIEGRKRTSEDEMAGWHHRLNGHKFEQAPGVGDGQGILTCCSPWGCKWLARLSDWTTTKQIHRIKSSILWCSLEFACDLLGLFILRIH